MAESVAEEYRSSLCDLNFNSKPHINMLTIIAEENAHFAPVIVETIVDHIKKIPPDLKLPGLYLVDSIIKNVGGQYITLFSKHVITLFSTVFEKVEETTRSALFKLRQTWNDILPKNVLYGIDCNVNHIDPAWPITAKAPAPSPIHVNPKFLGSSAPQSGVAPNTLAQPATVQKSEVMLKEREEMRRKQDQMLKMIEEKKEQLKALEQRKMEMAAKQRKKVANLIAPVVAELQASGLRKPVPHHLDPRLKKTVPDSEKGLDKSNPMLQSVVVVPNNKASLTEDLPKSIQTTAPSHPKSTPVPSNKDTGQKKASETSKVNEKAVLGKKHPLASEKSESSPNKKLCKSPLNKSKRGPAENDSNQSHPLKKGKHDIKHGEGLNEERKAFPSRRTASPLLFGSQDTDYRQLGLQAEGMVPAQPPKQWREPTDSQQNSRGLHSTYYPTELKNSDVPVSESNGKFYSEQHLSRRNAEDLKTNSFIPIDPTITKMVNDVQPSTVFMKTEQHFPSKPVPIHNERLLSTQMHSRNSNSPIDAKRFMLDGKNRTIHFINERAFAVMDDNQPREISFYGPPRNVYIEGLSHPLVLSFDGRTHEFETDGKVNTIRFGAPSREIYINNFPYEAQFGGPTFTALLEDKKEHRIRIDGPTPQVVIGDKPCTNMYEGRVSPQTTVDKDIRDVDMRQKPSQFVPEGVKDVDWRQVPVADHSKAPWTTTANTFENSVQLPSVPWDENKNVLVRPSAETRLLPPQLATHGPLQPPPSIPASLNPLLQSTAQNVMSASSISQSWTPLPPPPMFENMRPQQPLTTSYELSAPLNTALRDSSNPPPESNTIVRSAPLTFEDLKGILAGIGSKKAETSSPVPQKEKPTKESAPAETKKKPPKDEDAPDLTGFVPKLLKVFCSLTVTPLHDGTQCAECGMRFKDADIYSRHLDWHFRMNRREKERAKKAYSRPWYLKIDEWYKFIEFEQAEERKPSYFELQSDGKVQKAEEEEVPSVPSASESESEKCAVCGEVFRLKWKGDVEEWHLFPTIKVEDELYHPLCYDDFVKAAELEKQKAEEAARRAEEEARRAQEEAVQKAAEEEEAAQKTAEEKEAAQKAAEEEEAAQKAAEEEEAAQKAAEEEEAAQKAAEEEAAQIADEEVKAVVTSIKVEPLEDTKEMEVKEEAAPESMEVEGEVQVKKEEPSDVKEEIATHTPTEEVKEESVKLEDAAETKPIEAQPAVEEAIASSDLNLDHFEDNFRPPTPDPRFQVLPPTHRGNELSALCTIM